MQPLCRRAAGILIAAVVLSSCGRSGNGSAPSADAETAAAVREAVETSTRPDYVTRDRDGARRWKQVRTFYQHRDFSPAWIDGRLPKPQMDALIRAIHTADREGLDPE